jgi:hypothetical protein
METVEMALAQQLDDSQWIGGTSARAIQHPQPEPLRTNRTEVRALAKRKQTRSLLLCGGAAWAVVMVFALLLVQTNNKVLTEVGATTLVRQEITLLDAQNRELGNQIIVAQSVSAVETWAKANHMVRADNVKSLTPNSAMVAAHTAPQITAKAEASQSQSGWWGALTTYLSRMTGTATASAK